MNLYQFLGLLSIFLLMVALGLSVFVLTGHRSKKMVYLVAGIVFVLMIAVSTICWFIYSHYR